MVLWAMLLCGVIALGGGGQPEEPKPEAPKKVRYEDLPPAARLGVRVESVRRAWPTAPVVVVVLNGGAYIEAIGNWTPTLRFPVLIDDGTPEGREDIGRFVRGFGEARVVRWNGIGSYVSKDAIDAALRRVWSQAVQGETAASKVDSDAALVARWKAVNVPRSGIVAASMEDPAWAGALALAAGHAQPLAWIARPAGGLEGKLSRGAVEELERSIEEACEKTSLPWKGMGDDIDAVTLCMSMPVKVEGDGAVLATTDVVGRHKGEGKFGSGERWAWTGQVVGSEARGAYAAMCSLFLTPKSAWLFDGYPTSEPWSKFSMTKGVEFLTLAGIRPVVDESPKGGERAWRLRSATPIDAGLILVNTKGMAHEFFLEHGRGLSADVPVLKVPSMLHLVHSWSGVNPADRNTLGGRWLERGVYAYLGSVDEPFLGAFVPSSITIGRLVSKFPFAAAVRPDNGPAWKLAVLGDPLAMLGAEMPRTDARFPLPDTYPLRQDVSDTLQAGDFTRAIRALVMLGADEDAALLVNGLLKEGKGRLSAEDAEYAILPLFRAGKYEPMIEAYARLKPDAAKRGDLRDALWHCAYRELPATRDRGFVELLVRNIRPDVRGRDTVEVADGCAAVLGRERALEVLRAQREQVPDGEARGPIDQAITKINRSGG